MSIIAALLPNQDRLRRLQTAIRGRHQIAPCPDWSALHRLCETQPVSTAVFDLFARECDRHGAAVTIDHPRRRATPAG